MDVKDNEIKDGKRPNRSFNLTWSLIEYLDTFPSRNAFVREIIAGHQQGRFIEPETAALLQKYKNLFGEEPEEVIRKVLERRINKITNNMQALKDSGPGEVKNKVGG